MAGGPPCSSDLLSSRVTGRGCPVQALLGRERPGDDLNSIHDPHFFPALRSPLRLLPTTRTARRTRAYSPAVYISPVFHRTKASRPATNPLRYRRTLMDCETRMWRRTTLTPSHHAASATLRSPLLPGRVHFGLRRRHWMCDDIAAGHAERPFDGFKIHRADVGILP